MGAETIDLKEALLSELVEIVKSTKDFVIEQSFPLAQELIQYKILVLSIQTVIFFFGAFLSISLFAYHMRQITIEKDTLEWRIAITLTTGLISIPLFMGFLCNLSPLIKVLVAPRVYILDYLMRMF